MKTLSALVCLLLGSAVLGSVRAATPAHLRLATKQDAFFIENDFVYRRFLLLARDGSYHQVNRERTAGAEVDRGTWEQADDGTVLLHFTQGALRFHALSSGPVFVTLDDPGKFDELPVLAAAVRRWLTGTNDTVFAADRLQELPAGPVVLAVDPKAESFRRDDLESVIRQIDDFAWSEQHRTVRLSLLKPAGLPTLLVPRGSVFDVADLARVRREYPVPRGHAPPFYFAQVDAVTFAREAGSWQKLH